jgi:hypothetical protein
MLPTDRQRHFVIRFGFQTKTIPDTFPISGIPVTDIIGFSFKTIRFPPIPEILFNFRIHKPIAGGPTELSKRRNHNQNRSHCFLIIHRTSCYNFLPRRTIKDLC